jgi:hypothetical protein
MAAGNWTLFNKAHKKLANGTFRIGTSVFRCRVYKAGVSASLAAASNFSLITSLGTSNESTFMSDYTLSGFVVTALNGSATMKADMAADLVITASGGAASCKYAVVYCSAASAGAGNNGLLMWCKLSDTAFAVTSTNTLTIYTPTNGFFVIY